MKLPIIKDLYRFVPEKGGSLSSSSLDAMRWRALVEMNDRSVSGNAVLALAFLFVSISSDLMLTHRSLFTGLFSLVALSITARLVVMALIKWKTRTEYREREGQFYLVVFSFAVTWGLLTSTMLFLYGATWPALIVVLFAAGMGSGALANFCIWRSLVTGYLAVLFVPAIVVCFSSRNNEGYILGTGLTMYMAYLLIQVKLWNREYWSSRTSAELLKVRAEELQEERENSDLANRAKSEFMSSMSHELRTPMNAILGFAQMLELDPDAPLTINQKISVDHIIKGGQHLLGLIDQVLDLAKIESGKLNLVFECIRPSDTFHECLEMVKPMADKKGVILSGKKESDKLVRVDPVRLKQVILNLFSNGIKYNIDAGHVEFGCRDGKNNILHIFVSDTGLGIPVERHEEVFDPFNRLGNESTEIEGTGVGLTISKKLVEAMGGQIGFESEPGKGSTFWIEFPAIEGSDHKETESVETLKKEDVYESLPVTATVLYIEDNPANLQLMESIIGSIGGITLISAHTAEIGISMAEEKQPNLILMDINLPGMDGIAATKALAQVDKTRNIPVIGISAAAMKSDIERAKTAGFKAYLTKPFNVPEVIQTIKTALTA